MKKKSPAHPNILIISVDQMRAPGPLDFAGHGIIPDVAHIVSFAPRSDLAGNRFIEYFPGLMALRKNAVVLRNHSIASSACVPSRAVIYTGQYASRTGVSQTDGIFKDPDDPSYPWLAPNGAPTIGDWFRAAGYETHYFGKWHVSNPVTGSLEPWGFSDWELSLPEAQGNGPGNLGIYRDISFADLIITFLDRKALGSQYEVLRSGSNMAYPNMPSAFRAHYVNQEPRPWLAVASLVNPHDISGWPRPWQPGVYGSEPLNADEERTPPPFPINEPGNPARSHPPNAGTKQVLLNPQSIPEHLYNFTGIDMEELKDKPRAQLDSAYKVGLGFKSQYPDVTINGYNIRDASPLPFQLLPPSSPYDANRWFQRYCDYYVYLFYLVDLQLRRIMECLHSSGLMENTVVLFFADHGEYAGSHGGMIEKWYTAYQDILHVPCLVSSPLVNEDDEPRYVEELTSHVDILPTLLGLAGYDEDDRRHLAKSLLGKKVYELPGADLSRLIKNTDARHHIIDPDGEARAGILYVTDDEITRPLYNEMGDETYQYFLRNVEEIRKMIEFHKEHPEAPAPAYLPDVLYPGSVVQPNHVQCVRTKDWKLARYTDPGGEAEDEWEMYYLGDDPGEKRNLVTWKDGLPVLNERGKAHPRAEEMLKLLRLMLNKKLRDAGYPPQCLHPEP
jgi:arylsulfatase A-like enzyme